MNNRVIVILHIIVLTVSTISFPQGEAAVPFLLLKPGAEANGMAGSFTALARGANAMYYNPAGLTQTDKFSWTLSHSNWLSGSILFQIQDRFTIFSAAVYSIPKIGSLGIAIQYFNSDNIYFGNTDLSLSVGFARELSKTISGGITLKYINSQIDGGLAVEEDYRNLNANALAFDLGVLFTNFLPELCYTEDMTEGMDDLLTRKINKNRGPSIGITISNMGTDIYYIDEAQSDPLPQNLRIGLAWTVVNNDILGVTISSDLFKLLVHKDSDGPDSFPASLITSWKNFKFEELEISVGLEVDVTSLFSFRVGTFIEDENYGNRNYFTYGFSVGPELARFSMSFIDTIDKGHWLDGTMFFEGAVRL